MNLHARHERPHNAHTKTRQLLADARNPEERGVRALASFPRLRGKAPTIVAALIETA